MTFPQDETTRRPAFDPPSRGPAGIPPQDPRHILTLIGAVVYDWDLASDRLDWGSNAAEILGTLDRSAWSTGRDFAYAVDPGSGPCRQEAILRATETDAGSGVAYRACYGLRVASGEIVRVEDSGRWFADRSGRPAVAHGLLRAMQTGTAEPSRVPPGARERDAFLRQVADDLTDSRCSGRGLTVFAVSVANLSTLNEELGFERADDVMEAVADRLRGVRRQRDRFARYAGNRFAIGLRGCPGDQAELAAARLARLVTDTPVVTGGEPVPVSLVIGAASAPDHALEAAGLLRRAEQSLALAKRRTGRPFVLFDPAEFRVAPRGRQAGSALDCAEILNGRQIVLACQPIVDAGTREPAFSEALLRVEAPDGRVSPAGDVVPAFERNGLVHLADVRMLELAADHLAATPELRLSLNVSPLTLETPDWLPTLASHLGARRGIASRLIIEVTETAAIRDPRATLRSLDAMKALGLAIAIDDFGAGHTSFRHLRDFPVDILKLDGVFVQNVARQPSDAYFVRTLLDLARHLGIATVAEWVEDEETAQLLAGWGVDYLQGEHCGMPALVPRPGLVAGPDARVA